jgi:pimeloyl-ACP methyl ester carboxylesterase
MMRFRSRFAKRNAKGGRNTELASVGVTFFLALSSALSASNAAADDFNPRRHPSSLGGPMVLRDEGTFFVNGQLEHTDFPSSNPAGLNAPGTYTVGQMYVHYRIPEPVGANKLPVIMVHGSNHTGVTYETTPDGREGWATYFVRHGFPVYVVDQAGRGRSSFDPTAVNQAIAQSNAALLPSAGFQLYPREGAWTNFLFGPSYGVAWPDERFPLKALDQYTAQLVPNTETTLAKGGTNTINGLAALLDKIGPAVIIVHSQSGTYGLGAAVARSNLVRGLISVEGGCAPIEASDISNHYKKVPYLSLWGDHSVGAVGANGDVRRTGCQTTVASFQAAGGRAKFLSLPDELGIKGNSHMLMMDDNNLQIADIIMGWLAQNVNTDG